MKKPYTIQIDEKVHLQFKSTAAGDSRSVSGWIEELMKKALEERYSKNKEQEDLQKTF